MTARRGRFEGSIYQRADGRWVAAVSLEDGHRKSLYRRTKRQALAALREFELERSVQYTHRVLHTALKQAVRWNLIIRNPADAAQAPRPKRTEIQTLSADDVRRLLSAVAGTPRFALYAPAVTTGLRRGELLGLRWDDVDLNGGRLTVRRTLQRIPGHGQVALEPKTNRSRRTVALSAFTVETLRRHRALQAAARLRAGPLRQGTGAVFATSVGTPYEGGVLSRQFHIDLRAAGLRRMRFHDLRHTCATLLLEGDTNPKVVQEMLGHSTITLTLDVYSHVSPHMQERAASVFDRLLRDPEAAVAAETP